MPRKVAIVGYGHVGKAMSRIFPDAAIYDKFQPQHDDRAAVMGADLALVCVPTDALSTGRADISIVTEAVKWLDSRFICIKSTVPPGTTDYLRAITDKHIVFSPEYEGETPWQRALVDWPYVIAGGSRADANAVLAAFQERLGPQLTYVATDARTAELVKYMENAWLALQVTFAGEMYDIAKAVGADYNQVRELWALDPRVSKWHTLVFEGNRGFAGKCLPKDLAAITFAARVEGFTPTLLEAIQTINARVRKANRRDED